MILFSDEFPSIKGWDRESEVKTYYSDNLWEYINGAADNFISYGFQTLKCCDISKDGLIVTLNIYDMDAPINAFGIFNSERDPEEESLDIGAESVILPPYQCLMLKGLYYIKIDVYEGEITQVNGRELLKAVAQALPGDDKLPGELNMLPLQNKISGSEDFIKQDFLGLKVLENCLFAEYKKKDTEYKIFWIILEKNQSCEDVWKKFVEWDTEKIGLGTVFKKVPYSGYTGLSLTSKGIVGVAGFMSKKMMLKNLKKIVKNINK